MTWLLLLRVAVASVGLGLLTLWLASCASPDRTDWAGISRAMKEQRR